MPLQLDIGVVTDSIFYLLKENLKNINLTSLIQVRIISAYCNKVNIIYRSDHRRYWLTPNSYCNT